MKYDKGYTKKEIVDNFRPTYKEYYNILKSKGIIFGKDIFVK